MPKISALTELAEAPAADDYLAIVDTSAGATKKIKPGYVGGDRLIVAKAGWYKGFPNDANPVRNTTNMTLNRLGAVPALAGVRRGIDRIGVRCTTSASSAVVRLGAYNADPATGMPTSLIFDAGTVDCSSTGIKEITVSQELPAFSWLAAVAQVALPVLKAAQNYEVVQVGDPVIDNTIDYIHGWITETGSTTSGALPSSFPASVMNVGDRAPIIAVRYT